MMQRQHYAAADLATLGREWIAAWNSHDLERILALYAEDAEMTSDKIQALGLEPTGTLRGKDSLRMYWSRAFQLLPNLHFDLIDTYVSPDSVVRAGRSGRARRTIWRIERSRHCEPTGRANARPMTGSAKQSIARHNG
jgi:ketosteroid isomerase-like protein